MTAQRSAEPVSGSELRSVEQPGLLLVFASSRPFCIVLTLSEGPVEIGRGQGILSDHMDPLMSRRHAQVTYRQGRFDVTDLGSRNGSALNRAPFHGTVTVDSGALLRLGGSLFLCCQDVRPFLRLGIKRSARRIEGPELQSLLRTVAHIAASSRTLSISGESGAGKELVAQAFHRAGPQREGPCIAVNCAAIPEGVAERLIFGARRGAFSGAAQDSEGYIGAADGGTLFLDEVADLDSVVQGKLLRVIETGELLSLGATRARQVDFRVCTATHKDLRALVQAGKFRSDLYFRIGMPQVLVPPLRQRRAEIPWLIASAVEATAPELAIDLSLIETCMLREWPGNVRELLVEINAAASTARAKQARSVTAEHLSPTAGAMLLPGSAVPNLGGLDPTPVPMLPSRSSAPSRSSLPSQLSAPSRSSAPPLNETSAEKEPSRAGTLPSYEQIVAVLEDTKGNISATARALGLHRTQLRRMLTRYRIDAARFRGLKRL